MFSAQNPSTSFVMEMVRNTASSSTPGNDDDDDDNNNDRTQR